MDDRPKAAGLNRSDLEHKNSIYKIEQTRNLYEIFKGKKSHVPDNENKSEADFSVVQIRKRIETYSCL